MKEGLGGVSWCRGGGGQRWGGRGAIIKGKSCTAYGLQMKANQPPSWPPNSKIIMCPYRLTCLQSVFLAWAI
jgi:hypothetical protein